MALYLVDISEVYVSYHYRRSPVSTDFGEFKIYTWPFLLLFGQSQRARFFFISFYTLQYIILDTKRLFAKINVYFVKKLTLRAIFKSTTHCCYLRASVGIGMAILPLEGIYPQIKRAKVLFKIKTNNLLLIFNSIFHTGRQCL